MRTTSNQANPFSRPARSMLLAFCLGGMLSGPLVRAASTDISTTPLANTADITAKPNVMFILDSSGSMAWAFMPDDMGQDFSQPNDNPTDAIALSRYGGRSAHCNGVAYNPNFKYSENLPLKADGTSYPHISFSAAPTDGFQASVSNSKSLASPIAVALGDQTVRVTSGSLSATSFTVGSTVTIVSTSDDSQWMTGTVKTWSNPNLTVTVTVMAGGGDPAGSWKVGTRSTTDLNNSYYYNYNVTGASAKKPLSWKYSTSGLDRTNDGGFANECLTDTTTTLSTFTKVTVTSASADAQNYADWYGYYRKRYLMMRTVAGRSFSPITSKFRVGFTTISDTTAAPSATFLPVDSFEGTQKTTFYSNLYKADPNNSTPLRGALSKVGRYFANKAPDQTVDPMQYACQRNYAILSTDGYWNSGNESSTFGPLKLDGTTKVGQQDASEPRPMFDGAATIVTTTTPYTVVKHQRASYTATTTTVRAQNVYSTGSTTGCSAGRSKYKTQPQRATQTKKETVSNFQDVTGTFTRTTVNTNGSPTSVTDSATSWGSPTTTSTTTTLVSDTGATTWSNYGSSSTSSTCDVLPSPNPSATTVVSGPTVSNGSTTVSLLSTDAAVAGTSSAPVTTTSGGSTNSLADVAQYYYTTDLRSSELGNCTGGDRADGTAGDVCNDEVPPSSNDTNAAQHMVTFTLGMGVNGVLPFNKDYLNPALRSGSYYDISNGLNGTMWPVPNTTTEDATHVDDLWHAAVNGRGQYWATSDPGSLSDAISTALSSVEATLGASSSAATSSLKPVAGENNLVFVATFKTVQWTGDLNAFNLDAETGEIDLDHSVWSAQAKLDAMDVSARKVYYSKPGVSALRSFTYANLTADGLGTLFAGACSKTPILSQCAALDATPKAQVDSGTNMVNFLRGDGTFSTHTYTSGTTSKTVSIFRQRQARLGDIVNASPVYMSKAPFQYVDDGYADFVTSKKNRKPVVFAAANDGMLHAFSASGSDGGEELWAYVPRKVMPNLYQLADTDYKTKHRYFVDGTPVIGDVYDATAGAWKTILVGGLNSGGKGYYALDVTDPANPIALWDFANDNNPTASNTDPNLGLTYGNPIITKRANGTWVVVFTSGYNNTSGGADGNGHLYMLNAITGTPEFTAIPTLAGGAAVGNATTPSGLSRINAWIEDDKDNTATRFYGTDLLGNLWRFDTDGLVEPHNAALQLAKFQLDADTPQPITTRPELGEISANSEKFPVIFVGTGQYLGISDIADKRTQTIYAVKDTMTSTGLGDVRARSDVVVQTLSNASSGTRTASNNPVNWASKTGWRLDLPSSGERVAVDMQLQYTTLAVLSAIPGTDECKPSGGSSWLYNLDIARGTALPNAANGAAGNYLGAYLGVGMTWIELANGSSKLIIPRSDGKVGTETPVVQRGGSSTGAHRTSWRELVN